MMHRRHPAVSRRTLTAWARTTAAVIFALAGSVAAPRGADLLVSNLPELRAAIKSARPGDVIVMKSGTWTDAQIVFDATASAAAPIRLRAQTPGTVILNGASTLTFAAPHLMVEGLSFKGGALTGGTVIRFASHHGRLSETAVIDYNPPAGGSDYHWVIFDGDDNRVDRCYFKGKNNRRPVMANRAGARRNRVETSHFKDIAFHDENGREVIQIVGYGSSEEMGDDGAFFTAEGNLFEEAHGEGMEIISIKSNRNTIRSNTFRRTKGGITNRSGNYNVIEGNFILGEREPRSYGIRVTGHQQRVVNNYVADVDGAGLLLVAGEYIERAVTPQWQPLTRVGTPLGRVPRYAQVTQGTFAHNTFVNCGIAVGSSYKAGWPQSQRILMPEANRLVNNLVRQTGGKTTLFVADHDPMPPLDVFKFRPNVYEGNIVFGGPIAGKTTSVKVADVVLTVSDGLYRPAAQSPDLDASVESGVFIDMDGQSRRNPPDVGADEISSDPVLTRPLTARDVGPVWRQKPSLSGRED